jgi:16S rRNA (guanine1207-N2)-methyltransferase
VDDCLSSKSANSADLILNNPPFHQQNAIGDFIALQMFNQAYQTLRTNGELWVIGNRHLDYKKKLGNIFKNCVQVTSNGKFVILRAIKKI